MDEVDGMSGGDRGGSAELASLIRKTKVKKSNIVLLFSSFLSNLNFIIIIIKIPVICICNDVRSDKVKPLLNVCYDARFKR